MSDSFNRNLRYKHLEGAISAILDEARTGEPCEIEVFAQDRLESRIVFESGDFALSTASSGSAFGIRCIVQGRPGFITTNSSQIEDLRAAVREVKQLSKLSPASEHHQLAEKSKDINGGVGGGDSDGDASKGEIWDDRLALLPVKDLFEVTQNIVNECQRDSRVVIERIDVSLTPGVWMMANSRGVRHSAAQTGLSWSVMGTAQDKGEVTSFDYDGGSVCRWSELNLELETTVGRFRDSVVSSLGARHGQSYRGPVLLHPSAVADLLLGVVTANCNGLRMQDGMSSWKNQMGELVAAPWVRVTEEPRNEMRSEGWRLFDREGVPTQDRELIGDGRLKFAAHNCFSAHRGGVKPTGNASGGVRGLPGIGFSNLSFGVSGTATSGSRSQPGGEQVVYSLQELIKKTHRGLVLKRFSGNEDPVSGQFSGVAKNSWWLEGGERAHSVQEVMVSGNLFELLKGAIAVSSETMDLGSVRAPYVLVDGVSVVAG